MTADSRRDQINRALMLARWYGTVVESEFEWKAVRRLARAVAKGHGIRVQTHLGPASGDNDWPRPFIVWDPSWEPTAADHRRAAMAMDAFLRRGRPAD